MRILEGSKKKKKNQKTHTISLSVFT